MDSALLFGHKLFLDRHVGKKRAGHFQMFKNCAFLLFPESCLTEKGAPANYFPDIHDPEQFAAELFWPRAIALGHG